MRPSSSKNEERSTIGAFSKGPSCLNTGEQWRHEETSNRDPSGGEDLDDVGGGVETLLGEDEPSFEGERGRLVPLLSSIVAKIRRREGKP
jgi:hypothetical protein